MYSSSSIEATYTCIQHNYSPLQILFMYVAPSCTFGMLTYVFETKLPFLDYVTNLVIAGDFNMKSVVAGQHYNDKLHNYIKQTLNCAQLLTPSTTQQGSTLLSNFSTILSLSSSTG